MAQTSAADRRSNSANTGLACPGADSPVSGESPPARLRPGIQPLLKWYAWASPRSNSCEMTNAVANRQNQPPTIHRRPQRSVMFNVYNTVNTTQRKCVIYIHCVPKKLLLRNCAVDFVEMCNVCARKAIIKAAKRIINSDEMCRSYSDLNFGVTFLEHTVFLLCTIFAILDLIFCHLLWLD